MTDQSHERCPHCGEGCLKNWLALNEEERMIVCRLPGTTDYSAKERESMHRWCTRCWYEETQGTKHDA